MLTIKGNTPQYQRIADIQDITMIYGKTPNANVIKRVGIAPAPSEGGYPNTKPAPSTVAF